MKQLQFFKYATISLILLNVILLGFLLFKRPPFPHKKDNNQKNAKEYLNLSKEQNESFLKLANQHIQDMKDLNEQQRDLLKVYFEGLVYPNDNHTQDSILLKVQDVERTKIESTYQHFTDVKKLLDPDQHKGFEVFLNHAIDRILLKEKKRSLPPKDN